MFTKIFIVLYLAIAFGVIGLTLADYPDCFRLQHPDWPMTRGFLVGGESLFIGALWPITLPGMIAIYESNDELFCP